MQKFIIYSDGGARGNPGPAAYGFVIKVKTKNEKVKTIAKISEYIRETTNNQAEYRGVTAALEKIIKLLNGQIAKEKPIINIFLDSQLIVEQMNGNYKVKNEGLKPLFWKIRELIMELGGNVSFEYIPREENEEADKLVNEAIDKHLSK